MTPAGKEAERQAEEIREAAQGALRSLIDHPGWDVFVEILVRQIRYGRQVIYRGIKAATIEENALQTEYMRGGLNALEELAVSVYQTAGLSAREQIKDLFD
jgi:hypothetical protein